MNYTERDELLDNYALIVLLLLVGFKATIAITGTNIAPLPQGVSAVFDNTMSPFDRAWIACRALIWVAGGFFVFRRFLTLKEECHYARLKEEQEEQARCNASKGSHP
jgi:hypothetical protein